MQVHEDIDDARRACAEHRNLGFVPTMGALHEGHLSLIRRARQLCDHVAVSIFVNPTQFGPEEAFDRYPRPRNHDLDLCRAEGVSLVFCPRPESMYPPSEPAAVVDVPALSGDLEGAHRPGHFAGVCVVVAKLFSIVQPQVAFFGQKDYQQWRVIEAMTSGLNLPVRIEACPTVREPDGLALSSRNAYLNPQQRPRALGLFRALTEAQQAIGRGQTDTKTVEQAMARTLSDHKLAIDYAVLRGYT